MLPATDWLYFGHNQVRSGYRLTVDQLLFDHPASLLPRDGAALWVYDTEAEHIMISDGLISGDFPYTNLQHVSLVAPDSESLSRYFNIPEPYQNSTQSSSIPERRRIKIGDKIHFVSARSLAKDGAFCLLTEEQLESELPDKYVWVEDPLSISHLLKSELMGIVDRPDNQDVEQKAGEYFEISTFERASSDAFAEFDQLREVCATIDDEMRPPIRDMRNLPETEMVHTVYKDLLSGKLLREVDFQLDDFFEILHGELIYDKVELPEPDLQITIGDNMGEIVFELSDGAVTVDSPELFWDCHCERPIGNFRSEQRPPDADEYECPIHSTELGSKISAKFAEEVVEISHRGVSVLWYNTRDFWPPSVDAVCLLENLREESIFSRHIRSIADIGCGTGFLGTAVAIHNHSVQTLYLSDWLTTPVIMSKINSNRNISSDRGMDICSRLGLGFSWIDGSDLDERDECVDVCICNPPYLPDVEDYPQVSTNHTIGGTELLEEIIQKGHDVADTVYVHFSDIAKEEAKQVAELHNKQLVQVGEKWNVPFRVIPALEVKEYIEELEQKGLETRSAGRYKYWHQIGTYRVEE